LSEGLLKAAEKYFLTSASGQAPNPQASDDMEKLNIRIIGVDPGLASTGWGVVELSNGKPKYIAHGCIETSAEESGPVRLDRIYRAFLKVLRKHKPAEAAMESLFFGKNISSAMVVAEARGVLRMALGSKGIPVRELAPNAIKKAVTGVSKADKKQIQEMVRVILGLPEIPKPDHAADALGAAIFAAHNTGHV
jgi:crossover junction endodeoxyribonuclease RuvC